MAWADLSVVVLAQNEEANLPACLGSVVGADVWVVDGGSTDRTQEIALAAGAKVRLNPWPGFAAQRAWALERLPLGEWVLWLDADERIEDILRVDILRLMARSDVDGAWIRRKLIFLGKWIRWGGMWPRWHLRLVRHTAAKVTPVEVDERLEVAGRTVRLRGALVHDDRRGLREWVLRHVQYAGMKAPEPWAYRRTPRVWRALAYFLWRYVGQFGFLDGREGLVFHLFHAGFYRMLHDALQMEAA